VTARF